MFCDVNDKDDGSKGYKTKWERRQNEKYDKNRRWNRNGVYCEWENNTEI